MPESKGTLGMKSKNACHPCNSYQIQRISCALQEYPANLECHHEFCHFMSLFGAAATLAIHVKFKEYLLHCKSILQTLNATINSATLRLFLHKYFRFNSSWTHFNVCHKNILEVKLQKTCLIRINFAPIPIIFC